MAYNFTFGCYEHCYWVIPGPKRSAAGRVRLSFYQAATEPTAICTGHLRPKIPYPAVNQYVHLYPSDVFPWEPRPMEGAFTTNRRLNALRLFEGGMDGSESVVISPDDRAIMLNKFGGVFEAIEQPDGTFELNRTAKAWLGPGRPLGAAFDAQGNLIICDALKGLLMLEKDTHVVVLLTSRTSKSSPLEPDAPIIYANDLDVASDGNIYFTTSVDIILHRNAQHDTRFTHVPSLEGRAGFWDTVKGWGLGMCQVRGMHLACFCCSSN
eukprot:GHRR01032163.1.p1 GENE.GHRR01032163.1~~GHRR01032163.1.p1  ORF type:complete len:293 (+),score=27.88 GHRR01032163.1:81-881(+)